LRRVCDEAMPVLLPTDQCDEQVAWLHAPRIDADARNLGVATRLLYRQTL